MSGGYLVAQLVNGLAVGSVYALIGVGYSMVYTILYLINFAHGDVIMFGTMAALALIGMGVPAWLALIGGGVVGAALGMLVERVAYRPVRTAPRTVPMISALGAGLVISAIAQGLWGPDVMSFPQLIPRGSVAIAGLTLPLQPLVILAIAAVLVGLASLALECTRWGRATRCVCQDMVAAELMGIPVNRLIPAIYALGGLIGVAGCSLFAMYFNAVWVQMGQLATTKAWAAAMLGGVGNFYGAFVGGLLLGVAEAVAVVTLGSLFKDGASLAIIVAVLLLRPDGLFGTPATQRS
jgi:branched-chain amino acid transport system permease protein